MCAQQVRDFLPLLIIFGVDAGPSNPFEVETALFFESEDGGIEHASRFFYNKLTIWFPDNADGQPKTNYDQRIVLTNFDIGISKLLVELIVRGKFILWFRRAGLVLLRHDVGVRLEE